MAPQILQGSLHARGYVDNKRVPICFYLKKTCVHWDRLNPLGEPSFCRSIRLIDLPTSSHLSSNLITRLPSTPEAKPKMHSVTIQAPIRPQSKCR